MELNTAGEVSFESARQRGRASIAAVSLSALAHAIALIAIAMTPSAVSRPTTSYVLAYLIEADLPGSPSGAGKGLGVGSAVEKRPAVRSADRSRDRASGSRSSDADRQAGTPAPLQTHRRAEMPAPLQKEAAISRRGENPSPSSAENPLASSPSRIGKGPGVRSSAGDGSSAVGEGAGAGGGDGDGIGSGRAHARYGESPAPEYPEQARRDDWQGTVVLRVMVSADGAVDRVEIATSSGYGLLDRAAMETVRTRWRFVPAERDGVKVASWVLVPIRFALEESRAE